MTYNKVRFPFKRKDQKPILSIASNLAQVVYVVHPSKVAPYFTPDQ